VNHPGLLCNRKEDNYDVFIAMATALQEYRMSPNKVHCSTSWTLILKRKWQ